MSTVDERNNLLQETDIKNIMQSETGRRFMWRILSYCGIYRDVEGEQQDILKQLGRRQAGLYILGILSDVDDELVFLMMKEAKNKTLEDNNVREREQSERDREDGRDSGIYSYTGDGISDYI